MSKPEEVRAILAAGNEQLVCDAMIGVEQFKKRLTENSDVPESYQEGMAEEKSPREGTDKLKKRLEKGMRAMVPQRDEKNKTSVWSSVQSCSPGLKFQEQLTGVFSRWHGHSLFHSMESTLKKFVEPQLSWQLFLCFSCLLVLATWTL